MAPPSSGTWRRIVSIVDGDQRELALADGSVVAVDWSELYTLARRFGVEREPLNELDACVENGSLTALRRASV